MNEETMRQGTMNTVAIIDNEMFTSWVNAGFTEEQAMQLLLQAKQFTQAEIFHDQHCQGPHIELED